MDAFIILRYIIIFILICFLVIGYLQGDSDRKTLVLLLLAVASHLFLESNIHV